MEGTGPAPEAHHVPALDGVRAVAVTLVLLFHLRVPGAEAGFLGVDVFFALSGFLITSLLLREHRLTGKIDLPNFWARRARRLLPALLLLLVAIAGQAWLTATNTERDAVRGDLLATTAYAANWRLIETSSYFADTGIESPVQHSWSLAIEEQFYIAWPLLAAGAFLLWKRPRLGVGIVAAAVALTSYLLLALMWSPETIERTYMGTDTRIFEPLVGAAGAAAMSAPGVRRFARRWHTQIWIVGLTGIAVSLIAVRLDTPRYFGRGGLLISLSTLAVVIALWVGGGGPLKWALELRPVVWIGVISYGLYLWHWPLILWIGARDLWRSDLLWRRLAAVVLTLLVASASFYLVERPIRLGLGRGAHALRSRVRRTLIAVPVSLALVAGVSAAATSVPPARPGDMVLMVVGDSVPKRLEPILDAALADRGWRLISATHGGCSVTGEVAVLPTGEVMPITEPCPRQVGASQDELIREADPDIVLWWDRFSISGFVAPDGARVAGGSDLFWDLRRGSLGTAVQRLQAQGSVVAFVAVEPPGDQILTERGPIRTAWAQYQVERFDDITRPWNELMRTYAAAHTGVVFADVTGAVCRTPVVPCDDRLDGFPVREDGAHYTDPGGKMVVGAILAQLEPTLAGLEGAPPA